MRLYTALYVFFFLMLVHPGKGQTISAQEEEIIMELLDSANFHELKNPGKSLHFATKVLSRLPIQGNERIYIDALLLSSNSQKMLSRKQEALQSATLAIQLAEKINDRRLLVESNFMKATAFGQYADNDSSLIYYQKVIDLNFKEMDPYFVTSAIIAIGEIYYSIDNLEKSEEYYLKAFTAAGTNEYARLFALANLLGFYINSDNPKYLPLLDTFANTDFYKKASPESRLAHFESFLRLDKSSDAEKEKTLRDVYNYSLKKSSIVTQISFGTKLYAHLDNMQRYKEAGDLLDELYLIARKAGNKEYILDILNALYYNRKSRNNIQASLDFLEQYNALKDSLMSEENRNLISGLNIKFETAQKDHEIEQQKAKIAQQRRDRNFFIMLALLLTTLAAFVFIYFRNRAKSLQRLAEKEKVIHLQETERLLKEKEVAELTASLETQEKERNRIARDLHDGLGSMMSGISSQIEYIRTQPEMDHAGQSQLIHLRDMVKEASSELRRTSYELMPAKLLRQGLEPAIRDLCMNLLVKNSIEPSLEINADLSTLNPEQQLTLYRIVQELLNNTVKHAGAKNVLIQFNQFDHEISLIIEDDGKGFDIEAKKMNGGLGLGSLQSRVNLLKGFLDIASMPGEGTTVTVNFAVNP